VRDVERHVHADAALFVPGALRTEIGRPGAVRIERDRREALRDQLPRLFQVAGQSSRRVRVHVDETGRDGQTGRVDDARCRRVAEATHVHDPAAADADIGRHPRIAAAVEDTAVSNQDLVPGGRRRLRGGRGRQNEEKGGNDEVASHRRIVPERRTLSPERQWRRI